MTLVLVNKGIPLELGIGIGNGKGEGITGIRGPRTVSVLVKLLLRGKVLLVLSRSGEILLSPLNLSS